MDNNFNKPLPLIPAEQEENIVSVKNYYFSQENIEEHFDYEKLLLFKILLILLFVWNLTSFLRYFL